MVLVVVLLVVVTTQLAPQASQQLGQSAATPPMAAHTAALRRTRHFAGVAGRQHATKPGRPQVDRAAHRRTALRQDLRSNVASTRVRATSAAQAT